MSCGDFCWRCGKYLTSTRDSAITCQCSVPMPERPEEDIKPEGEEGIDWRYASKEELSFTHPSSHGRIRRHLLVGKPDVYLRLDPKLKGKDNA